MNRRTLPTLFGLIVMLGCTAPVALNQLMDARRLAADLHLQFIKASDAGNRAVMADTDEAAGAASEEAAKATQAAARDIEQLRPLLESLGYADERRFFDSFAGQFDEFRALDAELLPLAVENSNVKAQRLSFGPAREAAASFRTAVEAAARTAPRDATARADALAGRAVVSMLEILALQAPHIAEADDSAMTKLEAQMMTSAQSGRRTVDQLKMLLPPSGAPHVTAALAALDRFESINADIIMLSWRNSDVRSLALSLGRRRMVTAVCDDQLGALEHALAGHDNIATR